MARSLGELGRDPRKRYPSRYRKVGPKECHYCGRILERGMGVRDNKGYRCRRACTLWPYEFDAIP